MIPDLEKLLAFHVDLLEIQQRRIDTLHAALFGALEMIEAHCYEGFLAPREAYPNLDRWRSLLVPVQEWEEHAHGGLAHAHFRVPGQEHDHVEAA
jgi:hypothetical protein